MPAIPLFRTWENAKRNSKLYAHGIFRLYSRKSCGIKDPQGRVFLSDSMIQCFTKIRTLAQIHEQAFRDNIFEEQGIFKWNSINFKIYYSDCIIQKKCKLRPLDKISLIHLANWKKSFSNLPKLNHIFVRKVTVWFIN